MGNLRPFKCNPVLSIMGDAKSFRGAPTAKGGGIVLVLLAKAKAGSPLRRPCFCDRRKFW
jgi:hypothetical protein